MLQCRGCLTARSLYCNLCSSAQKSSLLRETTSWLLLCWHDSASSHHCSARRWAIHLYSERRSAQMAGRMSGRPPARQVTPLCLSSPPPNTPTPVEAEIQSSSQCGLVYEVWWCSNCLSSTDSWMQRPVICWRSCRINSTQCWMSSVECLAPGEHKWDSMCVCVGSFSLRLMSPFMSCSVKEIVLQDCLVIDRHVLKI